MENNYNSDYVINNCANNTCELLKKCSLYIISSIFCVLVFCLWLAFLIFQIALWFITYAGPVYVLILSLDLSQKIHNSDPQVWAFQYKKESMGSDLTMSANVKRPYDIMIMMTIYSCAFVFIAILINLLLHIFNKLKMKTMRKVFMYVNYGFYVLRFVYIMIVYTWTFPYYADSQDNGHWAETSPMTGERFYKELQNNFPNAPIDDMKYFWNIVAIGWVIFNSFTAIFGLPMKYSFSFLMAKICCFSGGETDVLDQNCCCCYWNCFCKSNIDEDYIIEDEDIHNENKYFGKEMTIYKIEYFGLLWLIDRIPPIILPECLRNTLSDILTFIAYTTIFFLQLFILCGTYIGMVILPIYIRKIQDILNDNNNKNYNFYTIGIKNIGNIYYENEESKITHTYNISKNYNILNDMTKVSLIIIYIFILSHILNLIFLNLRKNYCIVLMTVLTRFGCRIIYVAHIVMTLIYIISMMHFDSVNMSGRNGFYLGDKNTIFIPLQKIKDKNFSEMKTYWLFCSCMCVINVFISIFGFPIKYPVTFLTKIYNYNYAEPFEQRDKYTKEFLEKFIFSIYENEDFGVFRIVKKICCCNNNANNIVMNEPSHIITIIDNIEIKEIKEKEIRTETEREKERETQTQQQQHVQIEIKEKEIRTKTEKKTEREIEIEIEMENKNYEQCIICNEKKATCKSNHFNPCEHKVFCMNCHDNFRKRVFNKEIYDRCPNCRGSPVEL
jgi:hypothetical protein